MVPCFLCGVAGLCRPPGVRAQGVKGFKVQIVTRV